MRGATVIALIGIDGAGKTTQAKALADRLRAAGVPATYFENPGGRPLWNRLAHALGRRDGPHLFGRTGYVALEASVRWLAIARAVLVSRLTGRAAVMDRWSWCQYVVMRVRGDRGGRLARLAYGIFPRPGVVCFLAVSPEVAQQRVLARGIDTEELPYLRALDAGYRELPEFGTFTVVDADGGPAEVRAALDRVLRTALGPAPEVRDRRAALRRPARRLAARGQPRRSSQRRRSDRR
ncbi:dTMP kinase [Micromonospora echinofusca]|uniref:dTMP kinase n=1 Tax=Micromonospora echinofusca TaxID=47858 RepID=UPI0034132F3F